MGLRIGAFVHATLFAFLGLTTASCVYAQKPLTVPEVSAQRSTLGGKVVRVHGILTSSHIGPLLKDEQGQVAARLRFEALPRSAQKQRVVKDALYRELFDLANSIPDPDQPKLKYEVELVGVIEVLKKSNYDVYRESPLLIYPLQVLRITSVPDRASADAKIP